MGLCSCDGHSRSGAVPGALATWLVRREKRAATMAREAAKVLVEAAWPPDTQAMRARDDAVR
jgi:hypothetical protein